jgi:S-methylmethionine-dependent homocysteine/selenocysteine methylase
LQIANANLSEANFEIMQKNEEINQQKEEIFQTLQIAEEQRSEIHKKNENIIASINYA